MDQRLNVPQNKYVKPSKLLALLVLLFIVLLSCFIIQMWPHQQTTYYADTKLSLPKIKSPKTETDELSNDLTNDLAKKDGWTIVKTRPGDSLANVFKRVGLSRQALQAVLNHNPHAKTLAKIKPNQQIQFLMKDMILDQLIFPVSSTQFLVVSREGKNYLSKLQSYKINSHNEYITATIRGSLYSTAKRMNIPYKLIQQMTEIFHWEIDLIKDIRSGDQFSILYQANYVEDKLVGTGDILAVMYTNKGIKHQAIRHVSASGDYDYFTPEGASLKKAFSRYPIKFSHISSSYNLSRYHPILHYRRAHKGVDLAASIGTPIHATGDGHVQLIERHNGYGNMIQITHDNMYSSLYAHLLKFQKGLAKGDRVKRGQIIGYVGQTGLADGPHCHYEFHVNHQPKNPTTIALPHSSPVPGREMTSFKSKANTLLAQLKLYEEANLVAGGKKRANTG